TRDMDGRPLGIRKNLRGPSVIEECEASLGRLGTEPIDIYQCHFPDDAIHAEETMGALIKLSEQGKIRAIGVSNFSAEQMAKFNAISPIHSDQPHYSLLNRDIEAEVLPYCRENGIAVLTHSTMERGLLTGKISKDQTFPEGDHRANQVWFQPPNRARALDAAEKIRPIAEAHNATLGQLSVAWIIAQPGVTSAIVGARNPGQVEENARAFEISLSDDEIQEIRRIFETLGDPVR
ncbi:aldo/keto reductase, partial [Acidobacteriota bacterium]